MKNILVLLMCAFAMTFVSCQKENIQVNSLRLNEQPPTSPGFESECITFTIEGQPAFVDLNGWPCYRVSVPSGLEVDSVLCDFERPGYPLNEWVAYIYYTIGEQYNQSKALPSIGVVPTYMEINSRMYGVWMDLGIHTLGEEKVIQISAPPPAFGTVFHSVTVACHKYVGIPAPQE